ncbi:hypothetical protein [Nonomuraea sp. NPDC002799]
MPVRTAWEPIKSAIPATADVRHSGRAIASTAGSRSASRAGSITAGQAIPAAAITMPAPQLDA